MENNTKHTSRSLAMYEIKSHERRDTHNPDRRWYAWKVVSHETSYETVGAYGETQTQAIANLVEMLGQKL